MAQSSLIFPLCFLILSGCALLGREEAVFEKSEIVTARAGNEPICPPCPAEGIQPVEAAEVKFTARSMSSEEIRRLQAGLREVGLYTGPVDGVPEAKTRAAVEQLRAGCVQVSPVLESLAAVLPPNPARTPNRHETLTLQRELRRAGFNPGPADGIFGARTRSVAKQLKSHCPMAEDYAAGLSLRNESAALFPPDQILQRSSAKVPAVAGVGSEEPLMKTGAPMTSRSAEDIRALQRRLRDAGFDPDPADGVMGPHTLKALRAFEAAQGVSRIKPASASDIGDQY